MRLEPPNPSYNTLLCRQVLHANPVKSHIGGLTLSLPRTEPANDCCSPGVCRKDQRVTAPAPASCLSHANKDSFHEFIETLCRDHGGSLVHLTGALHGLWGGEGLRAQRKPQVCKRSDNAPTSPGGLGLLWGCVGGWWQTGQRGWKGWMLYLEAGPGMTLGKSFPLCFHFLRIENKGSAKYLAGLL